ncbi:hypothetical protein N656DRAFT_401245 [Canariomyces notabilis]|uniref:Uncharacterized protein n=1 Tax=Canariomyces notabilis TaxID=2074819 RepID=A0AAN6TKU9_9PEZI|nr:hypothetical protein N656DRAFT_401245 [Canariomyces arenarius]
MQPQRTIGLPACPRYVCTVRADETDETGNQVDTGSTVLQVIVIYKTSISPRNGNWGRKWRFGYAGPWQIQSVWLRLHAVFSAANICAQSGKEAADLLLFPIKRTDV